MLKVSTTTRVSVCARVCLCACNPNVDENYVISASRSSTSAITLYSDKSDDESLDLDMHFVPQSNLEDVDSALIYSANTSFGADTLLINSFPPQISEAPINDIAARQTNVPQIILRNR